MNDKPDLPDAEAPAAPTTAFIGGVTLLKPINRAGGAIKRIDLRPPNTAALLDSNLYGLVRMDTRQIVGLLPKISDPPLLPAEVLMIEPGDLFELGAIVSRFLSISGND